MKKLLIVLCVALCAATLMFASCGGGGGTSPKSLAKQNYDLVQQLVKLSEQGVTSGSKVDELNKKIMEVTDKSDELSKEDKDAYLAEIDRLFSGN